MKAIGLMSGTSLDGVDVAMIDSDGESVAAFGPTGYRAYLPHERDVLRQALAEATALADRHARPGVIADAERVVTQAHAEAVASFLREHGLSARDIDVVGFHGQTVLHRPEQRLTVQIGDGEALARGIGIPVVYDLRADDVAAGGQGAPLVPVFHRALVHSVDLPAPVAVLNIGGVSNISYIDGASDLIACDTGPGNALLDDFMLAATGRPFDESGKLAAGGAADFGWIAGVLKHPFFGLRPPKSLDRNDFAKLVLPKLSAADGAATLTALTANAIAAVVPHLPVPPASWVVAGGGARNATMVRWLAAKLAPARVVIADELGWSADAIEAQAFAFLAVRSKMGLPLTYPGTTGAPAPMTGGRLAAC